jgi:hypothetical protein
VKLLRLAWLGAFIFASLVYPAVWVLGLTAVEAWEIEPLDAASVEVNQGLFELDPPDANAADYPQQVMKLYGTPRERGSYLFVSKDRLMHPKELPALALLPVRRTEGESPLQLMTVQFFAHWLFGGSALVGLALWGGWSLLRRSKLRRLGPETQDPGPTTQAKSNDENQR